METAISSIISLLIAQEPKKTDFELTVGLFFFLQALRGQGAMDKQTFALMYIVLPSLVRIPREVVSIIFKINTFHSKN